jgi:RHS repeat-associated protein
VGIDGVTPLSLTYDANGRLASFAQGPRDLLLDYDASTGFLAALTDALGKVTSFERDAVGRVTALSLPDSSIWDWTWDDAGNLSTLLEPDGTNTHAFTYTPIDLLTTYTSPLAASDGFVYDGDRHLIRREHPSGEGTDWSYDAKGQLTTVTTPQGSHQYTYEAATGLMETASSRDGQQSTYSYDGSLRTAATRSGVVDGEVTYTYDNDLRVSELAYADQTLPMTYDEDGLLTGVGSIALSRDPQNGLLLQVADGDFAIDHTYDPFAEVQSTSATQGATGIYEVSYTYDLLGRIATRAETIGATTQVWSYAYDALGQLVEVRRDGAIVETYSYDAAGNRRAMTNALTGQNLPVGSFTYDDDNKLLQAGATSYSYDADGRLATATTGGATTTYGYNTDGTLASVELPSGQTISYLYDDRGRRIARAVDGVRTHAWLYRGGLRPVAEYDGAGNLRQSFVFAASDVPVRLTRGGQTYHIVSDHLGSPRLVLDDTGSVVVKQIEYDSFGQVILDTNSGFDLPFGFAGGHADPDHSLIRFGARDYDPSVGRWTAKDQVLFGGGSLNLYSYVRNDPLNFVDPSGLSVDRWLCMILGLRCEQHFQRVNENIDKKCAAAAGPVACDPSLNGIDPHDREGVCQALWDRDRKICRALQDRGEKVRCLNRAGLRKRICRNMRGPRCLPYLL